IIVPHWDDSVVNLQEPLKTAYMNVVNSAIAYFKEQFTDPITLNINFGWGEEHGRDIPSIASASNDTGRGFAQASDVAGRWVSYSTFKADLAGDSAKSSFDTKAIAALPTYDPASSFFGLIGGGEYWLSNAEAKALGQPTNGNTIDGWVGLSKG